MPWNYIKDMAKFPTRILDVCANRKCGQFNVEAILVSEKLLLSQFGRPISQSERGGKKKNSCTRMTLNPGHPVRKQSCYCFILSFGWFLGVCILCADVSEHTTHDEETDNVPKRRNTRCRRRGMTQKYSKQNTAKVWNQESCCCLSCLLKDKIIFVHDERQSFSRSKQRVKAL
jgi:hypothetical protein